MGVVHQLLVQAVNDGDDNRSAVRRRVLMRCSMRMRGDAEEWSITAKDISSTGMKAVAGVSLFPSAKVEVNLPNIGWIPGEVVRLDGENAIGIRFGAIIDPARTLVKVSGSYGAAPVPQPQLRST
jgi:hypothetical protein